MNFYQPGFVRHILDVVVSYLFELIFCGSQMSRYLVCVDRRKSDPFSQYHNYI